MKRAEGFRGMVRLAVTATKNVTDVVQATHGAIGGAPARLFSWPVYASIRGITSLVGGTLDVGLSLAAPLLGELAPGPDRDLFLAALNGVLGDHLAATQNPLAIGESLRRADDTTPATPKILVLVHGSSMNAQSWKSARAEGFTQVHFDYNSGLHVSTNGRTLAAMLEKLVAEWPVPVEEIAIVAHSMGGLIARSACHYAEDHAWRRKLRTMIFLGTPHHGAPLERVGNWFQTLLGVTRYSAPIAGLAKLRSAGVTDLRFGNVLDEDWQERDRFEHGDDLRAAVPLPADVACYTVAAGKDPLVPLESALGEHATLRLEFPESHRFVAPTCGHIDLLADAAVWDRVESWLQREA